MLRRERVPRGRGAMDERRVQPEGRKRIVPTTDSRTALAAVQEEILQEAADPAWDLRDTGWRVQVHGDTPLDVQITFPVPLAELGAMTPSITANRPVNAVPFVCAAAPGILTSNDLPPLVPAGIRDPASQSRSQ